MNAPRFARGRFVAVMALYALLSSGAQADRIILKDGRVIEGQEGMRGGGKVSMKTPSGQVTFLLSEVEKVEWDNREIMDRLQQYWEMGGVDEFRKLSSRNANRFSIEEESRVRQMQSTILRKQGEAKALIDRRELDRAAEIRRVDDARLAEAAALEQRHGWRSAAEFLMTSLDAQDPMRECGYRLLKLYRSNATLDEMSGLASRLDDLSRTSTSPETRVLVNLLKREHGAFLEPLLIARNNAIQQQLKQQEAERLAREARELAAAQAEARERVRQEAMLKARKEDLDRRTAERRYQQQRQDRFAREVVGAVVGGLAEGAAGEVAGRALGNEEGATFQQRAGRAILENAIKSGAGEAARSLVNPPSEDRNP